jgi:hypothetical protein
MWPNDLLSILYIVACCGLAVEAKRIRAEQIELYEGEAPLNTLTQQTAFAA